MQDRDWLVIIIDGADQAKFRVMKAVAWPKAIEGEHRPQMKVVGALAHGHEMCFNFVEENVPKGSNLVMEVLAQSLERIFNKTQTGAPPHLWIQVDNAGGENKNRHILRFLSVLVDRAVFRSCVLSFLQVGHTHEDIDGIFGIMSKGIQQLQEWDSPQQMCEHLDQIFDYALAQLPDVCLHVSLCVKHFFYKYTLIIFRRRRVKRRMSHSLRPLPVLSGMLDACRNWRHWLKDLDNMPDDGLTGLVTSNCHWLGLCRRQDVPIECAAMYGDLQEPGITSSPGDVMCLVKEYMSDAALSQRPFCFLRAGASNLLANRDGPAQWEPRNELAADEIAGMRRLCGKIRKILPMRSAACSYMEQYMMKPLVPSQGPSRLNFLTHVCSQTARSLGPALASAVRDASVPDDDVRMVGVRRRRRAMPNASHTNMPLQSFVSFRCNQGVTVDQAVQEWNGWQLVASGSIPASGGIGAI